jgi:hypothetical protein
MLKLKGSQRSACTTLSPHKPKKFKQTSARKLMATVFWDRKGVLMVEFMQQGTTITSEVYCKTLNQLRTAIQNKRHEMLTSGIVHGRIQLFALEHCWSISTWGIFTTLLTVPISL